MIGDLINKLKADSSLNNLTGGRVYPLHLPQDGDLPAVVLNITEVNPNHTKTATSKDDFVEVDITTYSRSAQNSHKIAQRIRTVLDNFVGSQGSTNILSCRFDGFNMSHYPPDDLYETVSEFVIHQRRV